MTKTITNTVPSTVPSFESLLGKIVPRFEYFAKNILRLRGDNFDEVVQDLTAIAYELYLSLVRRGKQIFYSPLVNYAIKRFNDGRHFTGSNQTDVSADRTQLLGRGNTCNESCFNIKKGILNLLIAPQSDVFRAVQTKLDFTDWYHLQTPRDQQFIEDLALGYTISEVAKKHGVSPSAIFQRREKYANSWQAFIDPPEAEGMLVPA